MCWSATATAPRPYADSTRLYSRSGEEYATHKTTNYARREGDVGAPKRSETFSLFKRGVVRVYQHCGEAHLHRYVADLDFRYNRCTALKITDAERAAGLLRMARDMRLTYRRIGDAGHA